MPSTETTDRAAIALTAVYVVAVLLTGYVVLQQILLSVFLAVLGVAVYALWRYVRASRRLGGGNAQA